MKEPNYTREPIALFRQIKEKKKSIDLLHNLKNACPKNLNIGIAIKTGDCFFDSVAQGLNELKSGHRFTAKSLREDCADYAEQHGEQDSWTYRAVIKDAAIGGYFVELEGPYGPIQDPKTKINMINEEKTFNKYSKDIKNMATNKYLKDIKNMATETNPLPIWGTLDIEGRMICEKYKVKIEVIALEREPIDDKYTTTGEQGEGDDVVRIVNYLDHFVPLLSRISEDITESQPVPSEKILGTDKGVPTSHQPEQKESQQVSSEAILGTGKRISPSNQSELPNTGKSNETTVQEVQPDDINQPVSSEAILGTGKRIPTSHQPEQEVQQKGVQKKLINSYRKEAIYGTVAVITALAFTASAIAAAFTQSIPLACLAGVALAVACICVYQLTQSHKDINELKSELKENIANTFLEEAGLKIYSLIDKAASKV